MRAAVVSGDEEDETETVEAVFAQARDAEATTEKLLVDDGWKVVEVEPEATPVSVNGHHAGGIGPTVELVLGNGRHANGNGNGRRSRPARGARPKVQWVGSRTCSDCLPACPCMRSSFVVRSSRRNLLNGKEPDTYRRRALTGPLLDSSINHLGCRGAGVAVLDA